MPLTPEQQQAVFAPGDVAVVAGAGTGKTFMLAERYRYLVCEQGLSPLQIVAVTFTEKAADELRSRVRRRLADEAVDDVALARLESAPISTIHALAARICRQHPDKAGVPPDFEILDEVQGTLWQLDQRDRFLRSLSDEQCAAIPFMQLQDLLQAFLQDPYSLSLARQCDPAAWPELIQATREEALQRLMREPVIQEGWAVLKRVAPLNPADKLEEVRCNTLKLLDRIENRDPPSEWGSLLRAVDNRKGAAKNWAPDDFAQLKQNLKAIKKCIQYYQSKDLLAIEYQARDQQLTEWLPDINAVLEQAEAFFDQAKHHNAQLDFNALELGALQALQHEAVRHYYQERWKAFLIDEFQDTNPIQGEIIKHLTDNAALTIVGDAKQSIYGFRRADVSVFQAFTQHIQDRQGGKVNLDCSFRTHASLVEGVNAVFEQVMPDQAEPLKAHRKEPPQPGPSIRCAIVEKKKGSKKDQCIRVEAHYIAQQIQSMLDQQWQVWDEKRQANRPVCEDDIAILARTWAPLQVYGDALIAAGVRVTAAAGGNLLETREALDALSLLRFLANYEDNLSLAAVLRSPFFAVSDADLAPFVARNERGKPWWKHWPEDAPEAFNHPRRALSQLLDHRLSLRADELLIQADQLTGYSAVLSGLPQSERRLADWRGVLQFIQQMPLGTQDVFQTVRRIEQIQKAGLEIPRLPIESQGAVTMMTIHAAKGLEWPVVIVPDLARKTSASSRSVLFDAEVGIALSWKDDSKDREKPGIFQLLEAKQKRKEQAEKQRILYVAFTRARDYLLLTANEHNTSIENDLLFAMPTANIEIETIPYEEEHARPPAPVEQHPEPQSISVPVLVEPVGSCLVELPATALSEYDRCPRRFEYRMVMGYPGESRYRHGGYGVRVGSLVHKALEQGCEDPEAIKALDAELPPQAREEALRLVRQFRQHEVFEEVRQRARGRERPVMFSFEGMILHGIVDLLGPGFVLDYKTDQEIVPQHHRLQLWVYAQALKVDEAYIAYLREPSLHRFSAAALSAAHEHACQIVHAIKAGNFPPKPSEENCRFCEYQDLCPDAFQSGSGQ